MNRRRMLQMLPLLVGLSVAPLAVAQTAWQEGLHYERLAEEVPTQGAAGRVEVVEVFSYGCPFCYQAQPFVDRLKAGLPEGVDLRYVHASFNTAESWPVFQRAWLAAEALGIAAKHHQALFEAVWRSGEIRVIDPVTRRLAQPQPTIEDLARFYARREPGLSAEAFVARARAADIDAAMRRSDEDIRRWAIPGTPSFVVNGRYRTARVRSFDEMMQLVDYLVALEQARTAP
ncbi:MAG: hypothetical protein RL026_1527 [Pseudomonadota bacterium]|jgi:thiol:disulfide interchange protein DsbA